MTDPFKDKAQDWDARETVRHLSQGIGSALLANLSWREDMHVMDFGAGTGLLSGHIAPRVKKVYAVDTSAAMLEQLVAKPELQGKVEALCQNILELPLVQKFDAIISAMALHHVEDTDQLFQAFADHLKPGAKIGLADLDLEDGSFHGGPVEGVFHTGFEREKIEALLQKHGFAEIRFLTAHTVLKNEREYPIFLVTASKP
ncbi:class I SAM-dependent methyltransferase [bacterium (Candidatus Blackallbacteria) CG17_big_fil_post_rev_8_21_14_2_50_48_46]|uniref:Class I SAM-dependent methyltransferase n=1 Tax=bacterium (Candidatus Blackallbacteria) CG17_big_fil_post_rev_8_21_14_2_50_48_46 TaxID=2014261 RepID=A0A2M7G9L2_9BACT|nr:MAG: methyltransferase type 12 [bacterium (Candidatus Blackallbacteria) CG18_big_fil_WC_8_21_14_2_50_49_26]PIW18809.1 MAG: class I SAM-dependent methyltransferase [bacterium (Candidatus Blackallbacteria) CG17_big_fil_post_rev_8_21_14_2_50_48_46]PIW49264.1 MAG: class I SAM-dependent methyltransferase [bacterium (Candidatus Blackallbacteria) CG13_big_fil_rev_8_21_14_2_50_49_14]